MAHHSENLSLTFVHGRDQIKISSSLKGQTIHCMASIVVNVQKVISLRRADHEMGDHMIIRSKSAGIWIPSFGTYTQEMVDFSSCSELGVFSALHPQPFIDCHLELGVPDLLSVVDPNCGQRTLSEMESMIMRLSLVSPLSFTPVPTRPFSSSAGGSTQFGADFPIDSEFDQNPDFQDLRTAIDTTPSIFAGQPSPRDTAFA
jgi:hypothetical protein